MKAEKSVKQEDKPKFRPRTKEDKPALKPKVSGFLDWGKGKTKGKDDDAKEEGKGKGKGKGEGEDVEEEKVKGKREESKAEKSKVKPEESKKEVAKGKPALAKKDAASSPEAESKESSPEAEPPTKDKPAGKASAAFHRNAVTKDISYSYPASTLARCEAQAHHLPFDRRRGGAAQEEPRQLQRGEPGHPED